MAIGIQHPSPMGRGPVVAGWRQASRGLLWLVWLLSSLASNGGWAADMNIRGCPEVGRVVLLQPGSAHERELLAAAGPGVALVSTHEDAGLEALVAQYRRALQQAGPQVGAADQPVTLLSVGPLLDSPDSAEVRNLRCTPGLVEVDIETRASRRQGVQLRRNVGWHPLARLGLRLQAGDYAVRVNWRPVGTLPAAEGQGSPPLLLQGSFVIR